MNERTLQIEWVATWSPIEKAVIDELTDVLIDYLLDWLADWQTA